MKYQIEENQNRVHITIDGVEDKKALLDNFELCQKGQCSCPTTEYTKLETMNMVSGQDQIKIELKSKTDEKFQVSEIEKCLEFTLNKTSKL
jgi:hypothetical protein